VPAFTKLEYMTALHQNRKELLQKAIEAIHSRHFFAAFPEHPSPAVYGETADADGREAFDKMLNKPFEGLEAKNAIGWIGEEESPYTQRQLGIIYPRFSSETLLENATSVKKTWANLDIDTRADILIHSLELMKEKFFEIAYATMHTTGQAYMMSFQASGPHSADRALESMAMAYEELQRFPATATWDKPMGKVTINMTKSWRAMPKGIGLVIGCTTFPVWNSLPGIYASLMVGSPVIVKPHSKSVASIAIVVACIQKALKAAKLPASICQLAVDLVAEPITKELTESKEIGIIDYTGGPTFGKYVESLQGKATFTEKAGVNSIILDSTDNLDAVAANLAFSLTLYSGQMCTAPQNFFVPAKGIITPQGLVSASEFAEKLAAAISALVDNPKAGPFVLGAIQNPFTLLRVKEIEKLGGKVVLESKSVVNPQYPEARTASPALLLVDSKDYEIFSKEIFGPIALIIETENIEESIALAKSLAIEHGAISCGAYATDAHTINTITDEMAEAFTPVSFNLTGGIYVNQNAAFSDFHVTGGNPAGNASFTNPEYVIKRFTWVGFRQPSPTPATV